MATRTLRVGFDFDGVIAYNPLRVLRAPAMAMRKFLGYNHQLRFPVPKEKTWRFLWNMAHETSFFPAYGFSELKKLLEEQRIEGYIITGRYSFLEKSLHNWLKKHGVEGLFKEIHLNKENEQPHLFKERMLKRLNLDYFVEDNWDIVQYLNGSSTQHSSFITPKTQVHWVYNLLDRFQPYSHKHPHLKKFLRTILRRDE